MKVVFGSGPRRLGPPYETGAMKRRGATLVEVLVAIFVMALGMMALLTLFPLGALRMAQAIQDDRTAACAANADAIATIKSLRSDKTVVYEPTGVPATPLADVFASDLLAPPFSNGAGGVPPDPNGPSNPVLVDPAIYTSAAGNSFQKWAGGTQGLVPRRTTSFISSLTDQYRWFSFLDDYEFERVGTTRLPGEVAFPVSRDLRYSWAYVLQRPKTSEPSVVDMAVLVFKSRAISATPREFVYTTAGPVQQLFDTAASVVRIDYSTVGEMPLRPGDWIMDASVAINGGKRISHAFFYRVVGVTEVSDTQVDVEVQTPFRGFAAPFPQPAPGVFQGTVIVFDGLVDVFERRTGWRGK